MTTQHAPSRLSGLHVLRVGLALGLASAAWCLAAGKVLAQAAQIPTQGTVRVAALRIQFDPDTPPNDDKGNPLGPQLPTVLFPQQYGTAYFNDRLTRVRSYFKEVSLSKLDLVFTLQPVVTARNWDEAEAYYGDDQFEPARRLELIQKAITLSQAAGVDFSQYDLVLVLHAGQGQESDFAATATNLITSAGMMSPFTAGAKTFPGAVLQSGSEVPPAAGEELSIVGRLCLGIADVLGPGAMRTGTLLNSYVGYWDLMDKGWMSGPILATSRLPDWSSPSHMNPMEKARMGWLQPVILKNNLPNAEIPQVETTGTVYRLWKEGQGSQEYFLLENRQLVGFDGSLPEPGLLLWRVNEGLQNQSDPLRLRIQLLQADGRQDIENQRNLGDNTDPFPGQLSVRAVGDDTNPSTHDASGGATSVSVTEISGSAATMHANLYIVPPMILSLRPAANFVTENVTPTFRARFSDKIEVNTIKLTLDGNLLVDKNNLGKYYDTAKRELTFRTPQLAFAQHMIGVSVQNPSKTVTESTGDIIFRVNFRTIGAGLRMVSVPYRLVSPDNNPGTVFGAGSLRLARYSAVKGRYFFYPDTQEGSLAPPPDDASDPNRVVGAAPAGLAYWVNLTTDSAVRVNGEQLESTAYPIPVFPGWNMIGDPFPFAVDWNGVQVEYQGQTKTLGDAVDAEWLSPTLYTYQPGGYTWVTAPNGVLRPWEGYWVRAKVAATLLVPPVESGIASLRSAEPTALAAGSGGWRMRLCATAASGAADRCNFVGVGRSARDDADSGDVDKPPTPLGGTLSLCLLQGGRSLAQDLRGPDIGNGKTWEFEVTTDLVQEAITLSWPDLGQLPPGLDVRLMDAATGRQVYLRTRATYTYNSGQGGTRRFRLSVTPRRYAPLAISDLTVERTRGAQSIRFTLNRDAQVTVEVLEPTGRVRERVLSDYAGTAGVNTAAAGRADALTPGLYLVQVTASASDGASVRAVRPLLVVR